MQTGQLQAHSRRNAHAVHMAFRRAPRQCHGVTKQNKRCSITVDSKLVTDRGKLAAEPLQRGGRYCLFHSQLFNTRPEPIPGDVKIFYLDF